MEIPNADRSVAWKAEVVCALTEIMVVELLLPVEQAAASKAAHRLDLATGGLVRLLAQLSTLRDQIAEASAALLPFLWRRDPEGGIPIGMSFAA
jgi:hypothetical protein